MRLSPWVLVRACISLLLLAAVITAFWLWPRAQEPRGAAAGEWTCSMHPQIRQPGPGKCPICGMDLVPVERSADEQARLRERAGLETEPVAYRELFKEVRTVGKLDYNERQVAYLTARIDGRVDRLYVDFPGIPVRKGDHLVDIYSPDLVSTSQNLLDARRERDRDLARDRLLLWGLLPEQVKEIETSGKVRTQLTIYAPLGGTVIEKNVRAGQYVKQGDPLYRIADLDPLWLYLDIYEYDLAWVRFGQPVDVAVEAFPGETFRGTVAFIDPFLDDRTRAVKVRVNLPNPERQLKPAMYASAAVRVRLQADGTPEPTGLEGKHICPMHPEVVRDGSGACPICGMPLVRVPDARPSRPDPHAGHDHEGHRHDAPAAGQVLAVRASAVLDTGRRKVAFRQEKDGAFALVELRVGPRAEGMDEHGRRDGYYPVLDGLQPGDRVVVRGGFLLDSQRQIEGMPSLLYPEGQSAANLHAGHGGNAPPAVPPAGGHKH